MVGLARAGRLRALSFGLLGLLARRLRALSFGLLGLLVMSGLAACRRAQVPRASPSAAGSSCDPFADVDHVLYYQRASFCRELGRAVPSDSDVAREEQQARDSASVMARCDAGDAGSCFWAADQANRGLVVAADGSLAGRAAPNVERGIELYRKSCDGGYDNGCLWLAGLLRDHRPQAELVTFLGELCSGERTDICMSSVYTLEPKEWPPTLRALVTRAKQRLQAECLGGRAAACDRCVEMHGQENDQAEQKRWLLEACRHGSSSGCTRAELPIASTDAVNQLVAKACAPGQECRGLLSGLRGACTAGNVAACYLVSNACEHDEQLPHALACHPPERARCAPPEEPPTAPPSCLPRELRGRLLLDERAEVKSNPSATTKSEPSAKESGEPSATTKSEPSATTKSELSATTKSELSAKEKAGGWRAYQMCEAGRLRGYLFEHVGERAASSEQLSTLLDGHRGALMALGAHATGFGRVGPAAFLEGDVRVEKALDVLKRGFGDAPGELCFGVQVEPFVGLPVNQ